MEGEVTKLVSVRASKGFVKKVEDEGTSGRVRVVDDRRRNLETLGEMR